MGVLLTMNVAIVADRRQRPLLQACREWPRCCSGHEPDGLARPHAGRFDPPTEKFKVLGHGRNGVDLDQVIEPADPRSAKPRHERWSPVGSFLVRLTLGSRR